jgi:hypothetical protein
LFDSENTQTNPASGVVGGLFFAKQKGKWAQQFL